MWETPEDLFDSPDATYHFATDVCATSSNAKCPHYYSPDQDGLGQSWKRTCWMNPPYGKTIREWIAKGATESRRGFIVVALISPRTDTRWFHEYIYQERHVAITFVKDRLKFSNHRHHALFPSMNVVFGKEKRHE